MELDYETLDGLALRDSALAKGKEGRVLEVGWFESFNVMCMQSLGYRLVPGCGNPRPYRLVWETMISISFLGSGPLWTDTRC